MELSKELARRAHSGTSFDPDKRADQECEDFKNTIIEVDKKFELALKINPGIENELKETNEKLKLAIKRRWEDHLYSRSNVMSSMITGPARFPTARNMKRKEWHQKKLTDLLGLINRVDKIIDRITRKKLSTTDKLQEAIKDLESKKILHEQMKVANKKLKSGNIDSAVLFLREIGVGEDSIIDFLNVQKNNWCGKGFAPFQLSNSLARIKAQELLVKSLEARKSYQSETINGVFMECDAESDRVRLHFDGKPSPEIIEILKKRAFRWSPTNSAWQRQLTQNAVSVAKNILLICQ